MAFLSDNQTLADLNVLGKFKQGSLFNIFNRVQTRGGELLLEEMFRVPLTEATAINERANSIRFLQKLGVKWQVDREVTEMAGQYLSEGRPSNQLSSVFSCSKERVQEIVYRSEKFAIQQKHISAVQEVLLSASNLLGQLRKAEDSADSSMKEMIVRLDKILHHPSLRNLRAKYPFSLMQTAECQYVYRNKCRDELAELMKLIYQFDVYLAVAEVATKKNLVFGKAYDLYENEVLFEAKQLKHLALPKAIGNDIRLDKSNNMIFLTGANMAGKSTLMKTLGISYYLVHMGFPVAADEVKFTVMEGIYSSINVPDDISQGWSHFYAEVMRLKTVANQLSKGHRLFILFDELFKGTNVKDAFDATLSVTQKLSKYHKCCFVISTHITEVGHELNGTSNIQFLFMPTIMDGIKPRYTYTISEGITNDRQGMIIIENERILEMLD